MKILVAMSGGVDSTVSAYLLKKEGHEVIGVNFAFAENIDDNAEIEEISKKLDIKIIFKDFRNEFKNKIIDSFVSDYEHGITPNPCAICNGIMKFEKLLQVMKEENCDMVATGHYANVVDLNDITGARVTRPYDAVGVDIIHPNVRSKFTINHYCIKKSKNSQKDQSYMLYRLSQYQLAHIIFPIGNMDKNDVRKIASEIGLKVADKKDSQDVCFIKDISYQEFIKMYEFGNDYKEKIANGKLREDEILSKPYFKKGTFVDKNGNVLGFHNGIINYTIGQRKGLNIAFGERKFVANIDIEKNQVVLVDNDDLMKDYFFVSDLVFSGISEEELITLYGNVQINTKDNIKKKLFAKLRYRHDGTECTDIDIVSFNILPESEKNNFRYYYNDDLNENDKMILKCQMASPVRAITPGQSAVFYDEDGNVMFGGRIL